MNASSSLRFPISFAGEKEPRVFLQGEAYFEIARNTVKPFVAVTDNQEVKVLGTRFNIKKNYDHSYYNATTLLEGSVVVNINIKLNPGEQLFTSPKGTAKKKWI